MKIATCFLLVLLAASCTPNKQSTNANTDNGDTIDIDQLSFTEIDTDSLAVIEEDSVRGIFKGRTWRVWSRMFKDCMKNEWIKSPYYFGPTNTVNLGAVVTNNYDRLLWSLSSVLSESELEQVIREGSPSGCEDVRRTTLNLETLLNAEIRNTGDVDLSTIIENANKTTTNIDAYQIDNLEIGAFKQAIKNSSSPNKQAYLEELKKGNLLLGKAIKVSGFTSKIELDNELSADLKAELEEGKVVEFGDAGVKIKVGLTNDRTIEVKSSGPFVVFAKFLKADDV